MCDPRPIRNLLIGVPFLLVGAAIAIYAAIGFNISVILTIVAPGWMFAAAALVGVAQLLLGLALGATDRFCACAGERCTGECNNMRNILKASLGTVGILLSTCIAGAIPALVPIVGQFALWPIIGSLFVESTLLISAVVFYDRLTRCIVRPV